jgi:hypothetical protein
MPITKRTETTQTIDPLGRISVLTVTIIEEDGVELARMNSRQVLEPGDSTAGKPADVVAVAAALWTPQKIADAATRKQSARAKATAIE